MLKFGLVMTAVGALLLGYSLTVGSVALVPVIPGDDRLFRLVLFVAGMVSFSIGLAIAVEAADARWNPSDN